MVGVTCCRCARSSTIGNGSFSAAREVKVASAVSDHFTRRVALLTHTSTDHAAVGNTGVQARTSEPLDSMHPVRPEE